ncbi:MAG TPA: hypothetical protein VFD75_06170, partial [Pyrinomonadaceae bacterium]|nr:hypothetical protein [Pyrinomonadaceae bacterium]
LATDLQAGLKIRLARIEVLNCQLNARVSIGLRQSARPSLNPYIAAGIAATSGLRDFRIALPVFSDARVAVKLIAERIDTASAGFLATPSYTAHIVGPRKFTVGGRTFASIDQVSVVDAAKDEFELFGLVFILPNEPTAPSNPITTAEVDEINDQTKKQWEIAWMGVER